jgi:hypothetical protein
VFENRVLWRIFGSKREEVAGGWRRLRNEELHILYASPNIIGVVKSRRMRARVGKMRNVYNILAENLKRIDHLENADVNRKIILK